MKRYRKKLVQKLESRKAKNISVTMPTTPSRNFSNGHTIFDVSFVDQFGNVVSGQVRRHRHSIELDSMGIDALFKVAPEDFKQATEKRTLSSKEQIISDLSAENARLRTKLSQLHDKL